MKRLKTYEDYKYHDDIINEEYRYVKLRKGGEKDPNEPFFEPKKFYNKVKWVFRFAWDKENKIEDFLKIKKRLNDNGIKTDNLPIDQYQYTSWEITKYLVVIFRLFSSEVDICINRFYATHLPGTHDERIVIPGVNDRFDVDKIVDTILSNLY